jgi:hypothetical protein
MVLLFVLFCLSKVFLGGSVQESFYASGYNLGSYNMFIMASVNTGVNA